MDDGTKATPTVYINCVDTLQYSLASHLSVEFRRKGISTFVNSKGTQDVIERASASVVVFSKDCLSSTSCLDKLVRVLQCPRKNSMVVVPVFYCISPSDVVVLENASSFSSEQIRKWTSVLQEVRALPGHLSREGCSDSELVEEIVNNVYEKLFPTENIGINSRLLEIEHLLCKQPWGIRRIGIWGMPGIGKTTLAKAAFDQISGGYEASCFIKHFDKAFLEKGIHRLLEEHFGKILKELPRICSSITRPSLPKDKLNKKRTLVVLDDVHNPLVAESFLGAFHWFGPGSLIIITSRDKQVHRHCQINHVYEVRGLIEIEALQLFSQCSLGKDVREQKLLELSMEVIDYASGNPLALSFYGNELKGKKLSEMETTFLKLKLRTPCKIYDLFKSSYETLNDSEKNIFLDIACFFKGEHVDYVMRLLEGCGFLPHVGIDVLVEKCLVTISENSVKMHRIIQDFGREIINGETVQIERRRRLWEPWTIKFLLEADKLEANEDPRATYTRALGTEDIEGIFMDTSNLIFDVKAGAFENMFNLRFLKIYCSSYEKHYGLRLTNGLESLPYELRLLHWENYPLQSLPQDFDPGHLVELNMSYSQLKKLWGGTKNLKMLKMVRLCHSQQLTEVDGICKAQNVELIDLQGCTKLQSFPATCHLQHLRVVNLSGCREIKSFPEVSPNIEELYLQGTGIREIPVNIVTLSQQAKLNRDLSDLLTKVSSGSNALNVEQFTSLVEVHSSKQYLGNLVCLNMKDCSHLRSLPHMVDLESLKVLNVSGCSELEHIQGFPRNLKELYLTGTAIKELPQLPQSLEVLNAHGCVSLKSIAFDFKRLPRYCTFSNCFALSDQVFSEYLNNALAYVECTAREYQQEINKSMDFIFSVSSAAKKNFTFHLQPGYSVLIRLTPSWRSTLVAFAILVKAAFSDDDHKATAFGFKCVCRWKDKEGISHRLEKAFQCWTPGEGVQKLQKEHMFVFCDLNFHPSTSTGKDPDIWADLIVFEIFPVDKEMKHLDESCTVTRCGVHVIAANGDTSLNTSQLVVSLDRPKKLSDEEIEEALRGLEKKDRNLLLYIACLFNDEEAGLVAPLIASIGLGISSGFEVLAYTSLICISTFGVIVRHYLLRAMGREIVRRQSMLPDSLEVNNTPSIQSGELVGTEDDVAEMSSLSSSKSEEVKTVEISGSLSSLKSEEVKTVGESGNLGVGLNWEKRKVKEMMFHLKNAGRLFGIAGMSGSGRTTLAKEVPEFSSSTTTTTTTTNNSGGRQSQFSEAASESSGGMMSDSGQILESPSLKVYSFLDLKTATKNFKPDSMLGQGGFGKVYRGWIDAKSLAPSKAGSGMTVAVKRLNSESVQGLAEWRSEVNFLGMLSHPNLVKLLGFCREGKELLLVYEFMPKGSLENHLFRRSEPFPWDLRIKIIIGAARALAFLHGSQREVIYRDFKTSHILLDSNYDAKLSDFGLAKLGPSQENSHVTTRVMGTYGYAAPECMATGYLYVKSDVYSFGVVLLEIMTGLRAQDPKRPHGQESLVDWLRPELSSKQKVKHIMDKGIKGQYSSKVATEMGRIILSCIEPDPKNRPHMKEVLDVLEHIQRINVVPDRSSINPTIASSSHSSPHHYQYAYRAGAAIKSFYRSMTD